MKPERNNNPLPNWQLAGIVDKWYNATLGIDNKLPTFQACASMMPDLYKLEGDRLYANMSNWNNKRSK